jgi:FtsH-binding integral membrane protein
LRRPRSESLRTVYVSFALALLATVLLAVVTCRTAWRALSWRSMLVVGCPVLTLPISMRSSLGTSGLHWLAVYLGSTAVLSGLVGLTATRQLQAVGRAVGLSIASALLLAAATVLIVLLLWHGDLN